MGFRYVSSSGAAVFHCTLSLLFTLLLIAVLPAEITAQEWTKPGQQLSGARFVSPDINQARKKHTHRTNEDDSYLTFVGGNGVDVGTGVHRTLDGDLILSMVTRSNGLITTDEAIQTELKDSGGDVYVIRFDPETRETVWATYFGSDAADFASSMTCSEEKQICTLAGWTAGILPGVNAKTVTNQGLDAWAAGCDMEKGDFRWVGQRQLPLDQGFNDITTCSGTAVAVGVEDTGNGYDTLTCGFDPETGEYWCMSPHLEGDESLSDVCCTENIVAAVGHSDDVPDSGWTGDLDPFWYVMNRVTGEVSTGTRESVDNTPSWYTGVACDRDRIVAAERVNELQPDGTFVGTAFLYCLPGPTVCPVEDMISCLEADGEGCMQECAPRNQRLDYVGILSPIDFVEPGDFIGVWTPHQDDDTTRVPDLARYIETGGGICDEDMTLVSQTPFPVGIEEVMAFQPALFGIHFAGYAYTAPTNSDAYQPECPGDHACAYTGILDLQSWFWSGFNVAPDSTPWHLAIPWPPEWYVPRVPFSGELGPDEGTGLRIVPGGTDIVYGFDEEEAIPGEALEGMMFAIRLPDGTIFPITLEGSYGPGIVVINLTERDVEITMTKETEEEETKTVGVNEAASFREDWIWARMRLRAIGEEREFYWRHLVPEGRSPNQLLLDMLLSGQPSGKTELQEEIELLVFDARGNKIETPLITASESSVEFPPTVILRQNYPNPFNPFTLIDYSIPEPSHVRLTVFDLLGKEIAVLDSGMKQRGWHKASFDASGLTSGVYYYRIEAGDHSEAKSLLLLR